MFWLINKKNNFCYALLTEGCKRLYPQTPLYVVKFLLYYTWQKKVKDIWVLIHIFDYINPSTVKISIGSKDH